MSHWVKTLSTLRGLRCPKNPENCWLMVFIPQKMVIRGFDPSPHTNKCRTSPTQIKKASHNDCWKARSPTHLEFVHHQSEVPKALWGPISWHRLTLRRTGKRNVQTGKGQFLAQELDSSKMTKNCGLLSLQILTHIQDLFKNFGLLSRIPEKPTSPFLTVGF